MRGDFSVTGGFSVQGRRTSFQYHHFRHNLATAISPIIEQLERRMCLSAGIVNGTLVVTGTAGNDTIVISVDPLDDESVLVQFNQTNQSFDRADFGGISIECFEKPLALYGRSR